MSENYLLIYLLAGAVGLAYAGLVAAWRRLEPDSGLTAFWVVIGDGLIVGVMALLWGLEAAASLLVVMAIMGAPQIAGYQIDRALERRARERKLEL